MLDDDLLLVEAIDELRQQLSGCADPDTLSSILARAADLWAAARTVSNQCGFGALGEAPSANGRELQHVRG